VIEFGGTTMGLDPIGTRPIDGQTPGTGGGTPPAAITDPLVVLVQITPGGPEQLVSFAGHALSVTHKANDFPSARVSLQLERDQLINVGTVSAPSLKRLDEYLRDDQVWIIKTARSDPQRDQELFRGHVRRVSRSLNVADGADIDLEFNSTCTTTPGSPVNCATRRPTSTQRLTPIGGSAWRRASRACSTPAAWGTATSTP
jgi:hypothetical protein